MSKTSGSSELSYFSTGTLKPSFFCSTLEDFSKYNTYQKRSNVYPNEIYDLPEKSHISDECEPGLANWDRWVKIHKQQQDTLSKKLKRPPQCLVMNTNFDKLYVNQEKQLFTEAYNFDFCDKYRGPPNFWKTDDNFKTDGKLGIYQTVQLKYDRSCQKPDKNQCPYPTVREYVGVPNAIYEEKGLGGKLCLPHPKLKWETSTYVVKKRETLKEKLKMLQNHTPEISDVVVVGTRLSKNILEPNKLVEKSLSETSTSQTPLDTPSLQSTKTKTHSISVIINEKVIKSDSKYWTVYFENNNFVKEKYEKYIIIKNLEDSSLRYSWEMVLPHWADNDLPVKHVKVKSKCFHFNKNDDVILPGSEKKLMFYFQSGRAGVFCEKWKFFFSHITDQWKFVIVELQAVVTERPGNTENLKAIDSYIKSCTRYTIARKSVNEIVERSRSEKDQELPYNWKFFEEQLFIYNNPDLFYDNKYVLMLKNLHDQISKGPWDYSVKNLRKTLLEKALHEDMAKEIDIYTSTVYQLMKPNLSSNLLNERHKTVNELLCCFVNNMDFDGIKLRQIFNVPIRFSEGIEMGSVYTEPSIESTKFSIKVRQSNSKPSGKKTLKTKSSYWKSSITPEQSLKNSVDLSINTFEKLTSSGSLQYSSNTFETERRKQEYLEAFYVKTYHRLSQTINQICAVIESFETQRKKTVLNVLKDCTL